MQDSEPKMTNDVKDSLMNIRRQDEAMVTKEKNIDLFITHTNGPNRIVSSNIIPNPINNLSNISSIYEVDYVDSKMKTIECYEKIENSKASDVHSHTSDLKSFSGDVKNYLNFFSLPMYGLCEKSTQTELSGRDIDDLDYFRKELCASSQGLLKNNNKDKTEFIKRLFPFLDDKKISYSLTLANKNPLQEEVPNTNFEKNFIQIKRKGEGSEKTPRNKTSLGNSTPILDLHNHIHIKNKKQNQNVAKRKKKEEIITELTQSSKSDETLSLHRTNPKTKSGETTPFKLISKKKSINILNLINEVVDDVKYSNNQKGQPNLSYSEPLNGSSDINQHKKDFNDSEFNISEIINDIKKSTRKEITPFDSQILLKKDSNISTRETNTISDHIHSESTNGNNTNTIPTTEESMTGKEIYAVKSTIKNKIVKKFDAYYFFKSEFALSKQDMDEAELEKLCRKEWNLLDKETKKIYNINAEREKKIHKLNKKNQLKQQMQKNMEEDIG